MLWQRVKECSSNPCPLRSQKTIPLALALQNGHRFRLVVTLILLENDSQNEKQARCRFSSSTPQIISHQRCRKSSSKRYGQTTPKTTLLRLEMLLEYAFLFSSVSSGNPFALPNDQQQLSCFTDHPRRHQNRSLANTRTNFLSIFYDCSMFPTPLLIDKRDRRSTATSNKPTYS